VVFKYRFSIKSGKPAVYKVVPFILSEFKANLTEAHDTLLDQFLLEFLNNLTQWNAY
jgi:hypothetical protein